VTAILAVNYVTSSEYKVEENLIMGADGVLSSGKRIADRFRFSIRRVPIQETLEVDIEKMVSAEVQRAYGQLRVPCIVEHAGLIFQDYAGQQYPGGLTKPMWNTLGERFLEETHSCNRAAVARAVVAYCDGARVHTFRGETKGRMADKPRGNRAFYWDTVFVPDHVDGSPGNLTYAEIVEDAKLGLRHKVLEVSQSTRALVAFLDFLDANPVSELWP
jgi:XTP/dITP diphosphohydrolase